MQFQVSLYEEGRGRPEDNRRPCDHCSKMLPCWLSGRRKGPQAREQNAALEAAGKGKEADSPLAPLEGARPCQRLDFSPETHFRLLTSHIMRTHVFKSLILCECLCPPKFPC